MSVSIIIPAFNAAATLAETLDSVLNQTHPDWEAVIVDDGSSDDTASVAGAYAERDPRIRVIRQANGGVSAARNTGIEGSRGEWLCFLDADDLLVPHHLERLLEKSFADRELVVIYGGWSRLDAAGIHTGEQGRLHEGDLFPVFAKVPVFAIHCCIIRRTAVEEAGGFDTSFVTCEDWDLWQRVARTGVKFGCVRETLAVYRMSHNSLSCDARRMLEDGLRVIETGHIPDPRVRRPAAQHADGQERSGAGATRYHYLTWCAGLVCGGGEDAVSLLELLPEGPEPGLNADLLASTLFTAVPYSQCRTTAAWPGMMTEFMPEIVRFLEALEQRTQAGHLARRVLTRLEDQIAPLPGDFTAGKVYSRDMEVAEPVADLHAPPGCERVCLKLSLLGQPLGVLFLPVFGGLLPVPVMKDAIAARFSWAILNRFFKEKLYPNLQFSREGESLTVLRNDRILASGIEDGSDPAAVHNAVDWTLFLQELWGLPEWTGADFYSEAPEVSAAGSGRPATQQREIVHAEDEPVAFTSVMDEPVRIDFRAGGYSLGVVDVSAVDGAISAKRLLTALTISSGYELCCAVVREALVGEDWTTEGTLRERLRRKRLENPGTGEPVTIGNHYSILPRRSPEIRGDSHGRRAVLPAAAQVSLTAAAAANGEPGMLPAAGGDPAATVLYAPDHLADEFFLRQGFSTDGNGAAGTGGAEGFEYNRAHFESLFARSKDPWCYTSGYEQIKYEQTLSLLPKDEGKRRDILELACAEGHFTMQLAPLAGNLTAMDISALALKEAAARCAGFSNVQFSQLDLLRDDIPGSYDVITCSEVLYYTGNEENLGAIARRIARALKPGGVLIMAHAHLVVDDPDKPGFNWNLPFGARRIGEIVSTAGGLQPVREIRTPFYRVHSFRKPVNRLLSLLSPRRQPLMEILLEQPSPLPPETISQALWNGGQPDRNECKAETTMLPIFMYHRVAPEGAENTRRWRVTPGQFEEQLRYLSDSGYYTPRLEDWQRAASQRKPLPGRAVVLTFDDGYLDFHLHARPLLKKYGFTAVLFIVAKAAGNFNDWDARLGEKIELMTWDQIRELQAEGFVIGSHTGTHPPLTTLSPAETVEELAAARAVISRETGTAVDAIAYPYGDVNPVVSHLAGATGHRFGFTCNSGRAASTGDLLLLPRIEVHGDRTFQDFVNGMQ